MRPDPSNVGLRREHHMPQRIARWLGSHRYALAAAVMVLSAVAIRVSLARAGWPGTDSDDSTTGLMARHILLRGERPIFFYGQAYMGSIEAYVVALMFALMGISLASLKYGLIAIYACFMVAMYVLLTRAFSRRWALVGLVLLALGADNVLFHQLMAYGGYLETLLFGALMCVAAAWLVGAEASPARRRQRSWAFAGWGLAAGLGIWSDPLVLPFVAISGLFLVLACWQEIRGALGGLALVGLLVGVSPWIIYAATAPTPTAAASFLQSAPQAHDVGASAAPTLRQELTDQVLGTVLISVPNKTGVIPMCPVTADAAWPPSHWTTLAVQRCMVVRGLWGAGFLALLGVAVALEARAFLALRRKTPQLWTEGERRAAGRSAARLMALVAPGGTIVLYALGSASASAPWMYSRYIISAQIALPALLATLWEHTQPLTHGAGMSLRTLNRSQASRLAVAALTTALVGAFALGTLDTFGEVGQQQALNRVQSDLVQRLIADGDTGIYAPFWTCYRATFLSNERVVCVPIRGTQFVEWHNRYAPYETMVKAAPHVTYVFPLPSDYAQAFPAWAGRQGWRISSTTVDGQYIIFRALSSTGKAPSQPSAMSG
jgi:hypothetical protein